MSDPEKLVEDDDDLREAEIRSNLKFYQGKKLLVRKFERQLEEHHRKTGDKTKKNVAEIKRQIVERVSRHG